MQRSLNLLLILVFATLVAEPLAAQTPAPAQPTPGALAPAELDDLRSSFTPDAATRAIMNAVATQSTRTLAQDRTTVTSIDHLFSHRIKTEGVTDQKSSGRCWLFAGLNILRPVAMTSLNTQGFEFSQNFLTFYDKLEKANLFLESIIATRTRSVDDRDVEWLLKNPMPDGGQWNHALALIEKYGVVPSDIMPETESSSNTGQMNTILSTLLRKDASILRARPAATESDLRTQKATMLREVYRVLALHLGVPPTEFTWRAKLKDGTISTPTRYTPREFYAKHVGLKLADYVCLHSVPVHPFDKTYTIRYNRNLFDQPNMTFVNLPFERIREYTLKSVRANEPVWYGCDVGKESDSKLGVMRRGLYDYTALYGIDLTMTKADRVRHQESIPSHAMVIIGVDMNGDKPIKWLVENSWGTKAGNNGLFAMYDSWFEEYTYSVIIHKKFLPAEVTRLLAETPVELGPWDPMFATEPR